MIKRRILRVSFDENIDQDILRGLRLRLPELGAITIIEIGLQGVGDAEILEWAAEANRLLVTHHVKLVTHHVKTMARSAYERIAAGLSISGICIVPASLSIRTAIEELELFIACSDIDEWRNQLIPLSLK